jgi:protein-tyrosine phosphatase
MVCLGNICRSPLAEGALRFMAGGHALAVRVDSAGTSDWHVGSPPDRRAQAAARDGGFDISGQRARQVCAADFHRFDYVLAMEPANLAALQRVRPVDGTAHVGLLLDFAPDAGRPDVPDPYYGGPDDFAETRRLVLLGAEGLMTHLRAAR